MKEPLSAAKGTLSAGTWWCRRGLHATCLIALGAHAASCSCHCHSADAPDAARVS